MIQVDSLHKFRSLAGDGLLRAQSIIEKSELFFSKPNDFNDPFDCLPRLSLEAEPDVILRYLLNQVAQSQPDLDQDQILEKAKSIAANANSGPKSPIALPVMKAIFETLKNRLGVLSLSARADHVLLWSHYADSHRGICLQYHAGESVKFFGAAQPVVYSHARPSLNLFTQTTEEQLTNALMTKADFWSYEQEWRVFDFRKGPGLRSFAPELLKTVILGVATSAEHEAMVRSWVKARPTPVNVVRATIDPNNFELTIPQV